MALEEGSVAVTVQVRVLVLKVVVVVRRHRVVEVVQVRVGHLVWV